MGGIYALLAVGFALIFSVLKFSNFAHGSSMMLCAYIGYFISHYLRTNLVFTILLTGLAGGCIGLLTERVAFRRLRRKNASSLLYFVSSFTLGMLITQVASSAFALRYYSYPDFFGVPYINIGSYTVRTVYIAMLAVAVVLLSIVTFFLYGTRLGIAIRALAQDIKTAGLMGLNVNMMVALSFFVAYFIGGVGVGVAGVMSLLIAIPTTKLRRDYCGIASIGFSNAIIALLTNLTAVTGGADGLSRIPKRTTLELVWISVAVIIMLVYSFKRSRYGRQCMAIKTDELAAKAMGINASRMKILVFVIGSCIAAYAGVLYGYFCTYVSPKDFGTNITIQWMIMVFFGGVGSLTGSVLACVVLYTLTQLLRTAASFRIILYSIIVLIIINYRPQGLLGTYEFSLTGTIRKCRELAGRIGLSKAGKG